MKLINPKDHLDCDCYRLNPNIGFRMIDLAEKETLEDDERCCNQLIYLRHGKTEVLEKGGCQHLLEAQDFIFIPLGKTFSLRAVADSRLIVMTTLHISTLCLKLSAAKLEKIETTETDACKAPFNTRVFHANDSLIRCWDSIEDYLEVLLSAKHRNPHSNSLRHNSSDDSILVTSPLIHFLLPLVAIQPLLQA